MFFLFSHVAPKCHMLQNMLPAYVYHKNPRQIRQNDVKEAARTFLFPSLNQTNEIK